MDKKAEKKIPSLSLLEKYLEEYERIYANNSVILNRLQNYRIMEEDEFYEMISLIQRFEKMFS